MVAILVIFLVGLCLYFGWELNKAQTQAEYWAGQVYHWQTRCLQVINAAEELNGAYELLEELREEEAETVAFWVSDN